MMKSSIITPFTCLFSRAKMQHQDLRAQAIPFQLCATRLASTETNAKWVQNYVLMVTYTGQHCGPATDCGVFTFWSSCTYHSGTPLL